MHFFGNILLLSSDLELYAKISGLLNKYEIVQQKFNPAGLMTDIYTLLS